MVDTAPLRICSHDFWQRTMPKFPESIRVCRQAGCAPLPDSVELYHGSVRHLGSDARRLQHRDVEAAAAQKRHLQIVDRSRDGLRITPVLFSSRGNRRQVGGDGGIRLTAPLSGGSSGCEPHHRSVHTYARSREEADRPAITSSCPPPAQVAGVLYNAIFLDQLDGDALELQRLNGLIAQLPASHRNGLRHIDLLMLRPSFDLGRLANEHEPALPRPFRFLTRGLGAEHGRTTC